MSSTMKGLAILLKGLDNIVISAVSLLLYDANNYHKGCGCVVYRFAGGWVVWYSYFLGCRWSVQSHRRILYLVWWMLQRIRQQSEKLSLQWPSENPDRPQGAKVAQKPLPWNWKKNVLLNKTTQLPDKQHTNFVSDDVTLSWLLEQFSPALLSADVQSRSVIIYGACAGQFVHSQWDRWSESVLFTSIQRGPFQFLQGRDIPWQ